jgi:hypothetical protein
MTKASRATIFCSAFLLFPSQLAINFHKGCCSLKYPIGLNISLHRIKFCDDDVDDVQISRLLPVFHYIVSIVKFQ